MKKVLFLTDANQLSGLGHLMRCLSISNELKTYGLETFFFINTNSSINSEIYHEKIDWVNNKQYIIKKSAEYIGVLVDSIFINKNFLDDIQQYFPVLLYIDDYYRWIHHGRVIIDWSISANVKHAHKKISSSTYLLGSDYTALRVEFSNNNERIINPLIKDVLVTFGGSDIRNLTPNIMKIINDNYPKYKMHIIIGKNNLQREKLNFKKTRNTFFYYAPNGSLMKEVMMKCDIAIAAGGQTLYELACVGLPSISVVSTDNQVEDSESFAKIGSLLNAGFWSSSKINNNIINYLNKIQDYQTRMNMMFKGQSCVDGKGVKRLVKKINNLFI